MMRSMPGFLSEQLTKPRNSYMRTALQTAMNLRLPPTLFLFNEKTDPNHWDYYDKKLAMAWQIMENETDPETNLPVWLAYSSDNNLGFEVKERTNYAKAELDKFTRKQSESKNKKKTDGVIPYIEPFSYVEGEPLPSRKDYYDSLKDEEEEHG